MSAETLCIDTGRPLVGSRLTHPSTTARLPHALCINSSSHGVADRWLQNTTLPNVDAVLKASPYLDFDFYVFDERGLARAHLEIKTRRIKFEKYADAIFPARKHYLAVAAANEGLPPVVATTEYACGTLTEVNLASRPGEFRPIKRTDRDESVPHVVYTLESGLRVIAK